MNYHGTLLSKYVIEYELKDLIKSSTSISHYEKEIGRYIESFGVAVEFNKRDILDGKEIDIYLPKYKIGIEFNGDYWHSELYRDKNYHQEKSLKGREKGVFIYQIWEREWNDERKKSIIESQISYLIGKAEKIYARNTQIK